MESNIILYYFIFNKPFSANKQHKYTRNGSKNQSFLYNTNGITHKSKHKLEQLRHCKPRDFQKYFENKSNANSADSIPLNSFHNYFSNLEKEIFQTVNDHVEYFCLNNNVNAKNESEYNEEFYQL